MFLMGRILREFMVREKFVTICIFVHFHALRYKMEVNTCANFKGKRLKQ